MSWILNQITASAISFTVAGNSGISSFLTLFILGCVEKYDSTILNMGDSLVEKILSSWFGLVVLGILTILEFVAMCVPVVDEITDAVMTAVIPIISLIGTLGTLGLYNTSSDDDHGRELLDGSGLLTTWKFIVVFAGIGLAITMHLFKMLIRLIGEGWLTNVLTVIETTWCTVTLIVAIFIRTVAIVIAAIIIGTATWVWVRRYRRTQAEKEAEEAKRQEQLLAKKKSDEAAFAAANEKPSGEESGSAFVAMA